VPYDIQAGGSYVEEDPLARLFGRTGFAGGGVVRALLGAFGKNVDEALPAAKAATTAVATPPAPAIKTLAEKMHEASQLGFSEDYIKGMAKYGEEGMAPEATLARATEGGWSERVYYHGTASDIEEFDTRKLGSLTKADSAREGFFLSASPRTSSTYAEMADKPRSNVDSLFSYVDQLTEEKNYLEERIKFLKNRPEESLYGDVEDVIRNLEKINSEIVSVESRISNTTRANVLPVRLKFSNPKIVEMDYTTYASPDRKKLGEEIRRAKEEGHDAVIFRNFSDTASPLLSSPKEAAAGIEEVYSKKFPGKEDDLLDWARKISAGEIKSGASPWDVINQATESLKIQLDDVNWMWQMLDYTDPDNPESLKDWVNGSYADYGQGVLGGMDVSTKGQARKSLEDMRVKLEEAIVEVHSVIEDFTDQVVVFSPEQIRSVNATFDPEEAASGRLLKADGGVVSGKVLAACNKVMSKGAV
jgi:hypothetical protein